MEISKKNKVIAAEICSVLEEISEAIKHQDDETIVNKAEEKAIALAQHFVGGHLELLDMAQTQSKAMDRIATAFERIADVAEEYQKRHI